MLGKCQDKYFSLFLTYPRFCAVCLCVQLYKSIKSRVEQAVQFIMSGNIWVDLDVSSYVLQFFDGNQQKKKERKIKDELQWSCQMCALLFQVPSFSCLYISPLYLMLTKIECIPKFAECITLHSNIVNHLFSGKKYILTPQWNKMASPSPPHWANSSWANNTHSMRKLQKNNGAQVVQ